MSEPKDSESNPFDLDEETPGAAGDDSDGPTNELGADDDDDLPADDDDTDDTDDTDAVAAAAAKKESEELAENERARAVARSRASRPVRGDVEPLTPAATEPRPDRMLVRIKPYNLKRGQTMRTHSRYHGDQRATFQEGKGWYEVDHGLADSLRSVRCSDMDPESALAFDVCTPKQARRLDDLAEAEAERESRATAHRPRSATN